MNTMKKTLLALTALCTLAGVSFGTTRPSQAADGMMKMQNGADYTVTFSGMWNEKNQPFEYPSGGALNPNGPHFSGLIGATHNLGYSLFKDGMMPTPGLEKLSEEGAHSPLDQEIKMGMMMNTVGQLFETDFFLDVNAPKMFTVHVSDQYPLVSVVGMIAPSPDWFVGVANVNLMENGKWVDSKSVDAYAWDAGSDDGATYLAADKDASPKHPTMMASGKHFMMKNMTPPVARLTFVKNK
ncbi:MAG TPA: spondin domain-containing protein [Candidatus Obscuribacterales bacterium]